MTMSTRTLLKIGTFVLIFAMALGGCFARSDHSGMRMVKRVLTAHPPQTAIPFAAQVIDSARAGDCKGVGDIDGDGFVDLILGGAPSEQLNWYRYSDWTRTGIALPSIEFTTDCATGDLDGDGDIDIVAPDGDRGENVIWFENPRPAHDPAQKDHWHRHAIDALPGWVKDVELRDFDGDGRLDVAARTQDTVAVYFQTADHWVATQFQQINAGWEGMASGDIDQDSHPDLVLRGVWLRNPGGALAREPAAWAQYSIGQVDLAFKALVVDLNQDGKQDVLFSSSEWFAPVDWWTPTSDDPTGPWTRHMILGELERAHTLQAGDMDLDGDIDVVLGQMHTSVGAEILVMVNVDGKATRWEQRLLDTGGIHNGVVADIDDDGDLDLFGANWTGNPPAQLWENQLNPTTRDTLAVTKWTYKSVTSNHSQTFGLTFGDLNGDGARDIVSGGYWYANPGGDLLGEWIQSSFPAGNHALLTFDVDGDSLPDVIAQRDEPESIGLYWLEATTIEATSWSTHRIGQVDRASHALGAQGYRLASLDGESPAVLISSSSGIFALVPPEKTTEQEWTRLQICSTASDEGFAVGDIDNDGDLDVAATTGEQKGIEWYENTGEFSELWPLHRVAQIPRSVFPDRTELADLNQDGRLDIVVTEENGQARDAETYWWQQPADESARSWTRHLIVSQGSTNSADVADMDMDGDIDLILAEHRGENRVAIWVNSDRGRFSEQEVSHDRESHLGARTVDLDGDGDLDIVSIAWDSFQSIHLWRNDAIISTYDP